MSIARTRIINSKAAQPNAYPLPDSRLEMPSLLLPNQKPTGPVNIDWSHPYTKGLVGCWLMDENNIDLTGNNHGRDNGTIIRDAGIWGMQSQVADGTSAQRIDFDQIREDNPLSCVKNNEISIYAFAFHPSTASGLFPRIINKSTSGSGTNGYQFSLDANLDKFEFSVDGSTAISSSGIGNNKWFGLGVSAKSGTGGVRFFLNGDFWNAQNLTFTIPTTATDASLLNWTHAAGRGWEGGVVVIMVWNRMIPDHWHRSIHNNRYQFLIPVFE